MKFNPKYFENKAVWFFSIVAVVVVAAIISKDLGIIISSVGIIVYIIVTQLADSDPVQHFQPQKNKDFGYESIVMEIAAYVILANGKIKKPELDYVQSYLQKNYEKKDVNRFVLQLKKALEAKKHPGNACRQMAEDYETATNVQVLHFLVGIVTADGFLTNKEYEALVEISKLFNFPSRTLKSILAMFSFKRENNRHRKNQKSEHKRRKTSRSKTSLEKSYTILEIPSTASDYELKKAYRKLAKLHHPDKVIHMGPEMQKAAKIKFQKIQEAYDLIKDKRGLP